MADLVHHGLEIALHLLHPDRDRVTEVEMNGVICEYRRGVAGEVHAVANEDPNPDHKTEAHGAIIRIAKAKGKSKPIT